MIKHASISSLRNPAILTLSWLIYEWGRLSVEANPGIGTVSQGSASFSTAGSLETITTSANTFINWSSFNINAGETTTFVQPSASSIVWNNIAGGNASQILGNLNANGYVILQNPSGFYVGGQAAISVHGLILSTAPIPAPNLSGGGPWDFNAPPPTAKIVNYGQINIGGGGSAFLIADDIENKGNISAPNGSIGLYAGEQVLVSTAPNGLGLSARVTLPQGSVDNQGRLIADGGSIAAEAQTINQNGLVQANSMQNVNGTIELVGSDMVSLGSSSVILAQGDSSGTSSGGSVTVQSGGTFSDQVGSTIKVAGGTQGGNGGQAEISAPEMGSIQSSIDGQASPGFAGGTLTIDPANIWLASSSTDSKAPADYSIINVNSYNGLSSINLQADNNITLNTLWTLSDPGVSATLSLIAGNNITLNDGSGIAAGNNWAVNLSAGTAFVKSSAQPVPASGNDGIYLNGSSYIQTENGNINLSAANEVVVNNGFINSGYNTIQGNGGNINVTTTFGDVNTGSDPSGFVYGYTAPYFSAASTVGGISTLSGGNLGIQAGGDVISYVPKSGDTSDPGTGAFGSAPGNVTINAGGSVYGHYVLVNGTGSITAGGNVGVASGGDIFSLSLVSGTWNVNAPDGNIYLQEVRNPNGDFNAVTLTGGLHHKPNPGLHLFDYAADATVDLTAGDGVYLTANDIVDSPDTALPRVATSDDNKIQVIYPPILDITAGAGGINLEGDVTLFPSADQNLKLTTIDGGNLTATLETVSPTIQLLMSDSSQAQWIDNTSLGLPLPFSLQDNSSGLPPQSGNPNPVSINISGSIENLNLITSKATDVTVGGNMINSGFSGQNLNGNDVTSITVAGQIFNQSSFSYVDNVTIPDVPSSDLLPGLPSAWYDVFYLAVNPSALVNLTIPNTVNSTQWAQYLLGSGSVSLFGAGGFLTGTPSLPSGLIGSATGGAGFSYNPVTSQLGLVNQLSSQIASDLEQPITILKLVNGQPVPTTVVNPNGTTSTTWETTTVNWAPAAVVQTLYADNVGVPGLNTPSLGYQVGGPGAFDINAGSISLGSCYGILSCGVNDPASSAPAVGLNRYGNLFSITPSGATVNVTVTGDIDMLSSTIASLGGGDVNVISTCGSITLGSENLVDDYRALGFGIFSSGPGNVKVSALDDINIGGSRIAAYDGGNIFVESFQGSVAVGTGANNYINVQLSYIDPNGNGNYYTEAVAGSGILATTLATPNPEYQTYSKPGTDWPAERAAVPGNITVEAPQGNITSTLGGITQQALNGNIDGGPTVTLIAGTLPTGKPGDLDYAPGYPGNIDLGQSGVIGGTVNITANGNVNGSIFSRQDSNISASQNVNVQDVAGGKADVSGQTVTGDIVGGEGVSAVGDVTAAIFGQNVSVNGGASQSTLGSSATATSTSQSAAQQANSANQQLASNDYGSDDDDKKKHKKTQPLMERVKRVTVILPKT